jgi:hypothetical protein
MARQPRNEFEGAFHHETSRGNMRDRIFFYDQDRHRFLDIVKGGGKEKRKRQGFQEIGWRTEGEAIKC